MYRVTSREPLGCPYTSFFPIKLFYKDIEAEIYEILRILIFKNKPEAEKDSISYLKICKYSKIYVFKSTVENYSFH